MLPTCSSGHAVSSVSKDPPHLARRRARARALFFSFRFSRPNQNFRPMPANGRPWLFFSFIGLGACFGRPRGSQHRPSNSVPQQPPQCRNWDDKNTKLKDTPVPRAGRYRCQWPAPVRIPVPPATRTGPQSSRLGGEGKPVRMQVYVPGPAAS